MLGSSPAGDARFRSLMGQWAAARFENIGAFGCLRSLRARMALDGVSWVQGGSVEVAVGLEDRVLQNRRRHLRPPGAPLHSGARLDLRLVDVARLGRFELGAVLQHGMHDDREAPGKGNPRLAHSRSPGDRQCPILELQRPLTNACTGWWQFAVSAKYAVLSSDVGPAARFRPPAAAREAGRPDLGVAVV